ncbi:hypothetical protein D3C87_278610 [compost metagenome]
MNGKCKLKPYDSRLDAGSEAVRQTRRKKFDKRNNGIMVRVVAYHCSDCGKWHLKTESGQIEKKEPPDVATTENYSNNPA